MSRIDDSTILITGGTGSFGYAFTKLLLREHDPEAVRIYSRGEHAQAGMRSHFDNDERLRFLIGNVRDKDRLHRAMNGVDLAVHAAALKRVPAAEYNPIEAKGTNIDGAANVIDAAIDNEVEDVMAISTDKAVHPVNLYGATKLVAEKLFIQGNAYAGPRETSFSVVRYGNVFGSKGSVVPLFMKQREEGRLTITHEDMTRFWITLEEGVRFVRDDVTDPDLPIYEDADALYALNLPPELQVPVADIARRVGADLAFTTLGGDPATVPTRPATVAGGTLHWLRRTDDA